MIAMKCSMHHGKRWSRKHNVRDFDKKEWNKDGHIDDKRSELNVILKDVLLECAFDQLFGDALVAYNAKNYIKHSERLIGFHSKKEYEKATPEERRTKAVRAYMNEQKKNIQEAIFQLGDHEKYMELVELHGKEEADKIYCQYLKAVYEKFVEDAPYMYVFSAVIHMDETKYGTPHIHVDYFPFCESARGLTSKVSMDGALRQLGYDRKKRSEDGNAEKFGTRPYIRWLNDMRISFEDFAQVFCNENKLDIMILPSEKSVARHEQPEDWKARQGRVEATNGKVAAFLGKDKKAKLDAVEHIIGNAKATAESLTNEAKSAKKEATAKLAEAKQFSAAAQLSAESADAFRKKAIADAKAVKRARDELDETVRQAVSMAVAERDRRIEELETENAMLKKQLTKERMKSYDNG